MSRLLAYTITVIATISSAGLLCWGEKLGPALLLPNDVIASSTSGGGSERTTTVYGFLDFTTTIDQTVVVFRPSSASSQDMAASQQSSSSSSHASSTSSGAATTLYGDSSISTTAATTTTIRTKADDEVKLTITPTPTIRPRPTPNVSAASALADKRRRFLAQVRRQRPTPNQAVTNANDQEMAESIDVTPSKVKRYQQSVHAENGGGRAQQLLRKGYRRPDNHPRSFAKNRLLALRNRNSNKSRLDGQTTPAAKTEEEPLKPAPNPVSVAVLTSTFDPTSATIAEYLPLDDEEEEKLEEARPEVNTVKASKILPLQLEGSQTNFLHISASSSSAVSTPVQEEEDSMATVPLAERYDNGLTVPIKLSIVTSTFSLTETKLRTSLLPVYDGTSTTFYTLTHSFLVTKTITTFQTVPPEEFMPYLIPANDSIDAINEVLPFDWMDDDDDTLQRKPDSVPAAAEVVTQEASERTDVSPVTEQQQQPQFPQNYPQVNPLLQNLPFLNLLGPAAALGLNPYFPYGLGPQQLGPQLVTTSRPVLSTSVVFTSKLLPIIDGLTTSYHTVHQPASTLTHTSFETYTTQLQASAPQPGPHPGAAGAGAMSTVTNPYTFVTTETQTSTQVFKLMYDGYKTSYRTVSSLTEVTRTVTTHSTTTVPLYTHAPMLPYFG